MSDASHPDWIIDTTDESFENDVILASQNQIVLVDFWASWCQPCRLLAPNLEDAVSRFNGDVRLVKVNTEIAPETAQSFQVESIPIVYAFTDGKPIDYFQGVIEADEIAGWIEQLQIHRNIMSADSLTDTDPAAAVEAWNTLLAKDGENAILQIGLARALSMSGRTNEAAALIDKLEERGFLEPEAEKVKAIIALSSGSEDSDLTSARSKYSENPDNHQCAMEFAEALAAASEYEEAFQIAIDVYAADKLGVGKNAHQFLLTAFKALPEDDELVHKYRRKLAMLMY